MNDGDSKAITGKPSNGGWTLSDKVLQMTEERQGKEKLLPFYLSCHLVLTIYFPLFPFSLTFSSSVIPLHLLPLKLSR